MNAARTKTQERILEAVGRGYYVNPDGAAYGPKGRLSIKRRGRQRYPTISTNWGGTVFGIPAHHLAAYCFYGDSSFDTAVVIRHLNGNTEDLSLDNIVLGTHSQNNLDKSPEVRKSAAQKARMAQGIAAKNRKLTSEQVEEVKVFYDKLSGKKAPSGAVMALGKRLGVSRTVLIKIKNGEYYAC